VIVHHVVSGPADAPALMLANSLGSSLAIARSPARDRRRDPGARLEVLDGAAHLANLERGDDVVRLITEHLEA
jgi:3-oxoadipate enol-lactonase